MHRGSSVFLAPKESLSLIKTRYLGQELSFHLDQPYCSLGQSSGFPDAPLPAQVVRAASSALERVGQRCSIMKPTSKLSSRTSLAWTKQKWRSWSSLAS